MGANESRAKGGGDHENSKWEFGWEQVNSLIFLPVETGKRPELMIFISFSPSARKCMTARWAETALSKLTRDASHHVIGHHRVSSLFCMVICASYIEAGSDLPKAC